MMTPSRLQSILCNTNGRLLRAKMKSASSGIELICINFFELRIMSTIISIIISIISFYMPCQIRQLFSSCFLLSLLIYMYNVKLTQLHIYDLSPPYFVFTPQGKGNIEYRNKRTVNLLAYQTTRYPQPQDTKETERKKQREGERVSERKVSNSYDR